MAESAQSGSDAIGADAAAGAAGGCGGGGAPGRAAHPDCGTAVELRDAGPLIVATVRLADCDPWRAMAAFTDPVVLSRWWRGELIADLVAGGEYSVSFPAIPARLAGRVISYAPGRSLEFTWVWDGDEAPPGVVTVRAEPAADGQSAVLTIEHGPHSGDESGQKAHTKHWDGWEFFLPQLPAAVQAR